MKKKQFGAIIASVLILVAVLAGLFMTYNRAQIETQNHQAEIVLDWSQIVALGLRTDSSYEEVLQQFVPYITGILIKEPTISDLSTEGRAVVFGGDELKWQALQGGVIPIKDIKTNYRYILFYDEEDALRVLASMNSKQKASYAELFYFDNFYILGTSLTKTELSLMGIGFEKEMLDLLQKYELGVAVQLRGFDNLTREAIVSTVKILADYRVIGVGFNDSEVPGFNLPTEEWVECKKAWMEALENINAPLITVEFFNQSGLQSLAQSMSPSVLRMHSMSEAEMKKQTAVEGAAQRYQLATAERNIKIAFVRMLPGSEISESVAFVSSIKTAIAEKGTAVQAVSAPNVLHVPLWIMFMLVGGTCAGGYLLGQRFKLGKWSLILALLAFAGGAGLLLIGRAAMVQKLFALCAVIIFPTLSIMIFQPEKGLNFGKAILRIVYTCLFSMIGAVLMIGFLGDSLYMLKINGFIGVKVAHLIPVLLVLAYFFFLKDKNNSPVLKLKKAWNYKISIGFAVIGIVALGVLWFYLSRTGNEAAPVSGVEKWMRVFLDQMLYVRPRTKEFLIGYPCLLFMYYYGYRDWFLPVMSMAVIGQVSLVNTYAHIHTPLIYAMLRSINGFWLGIILAVLAISVISIAIKVWHKYYKSV